ncbi:gamma-secretase subunit PEN-2-like [Oscarella lobularis]|uniref:gamma-secretase subunit PEN-2-like n=1 Tax=Oscarella lobularis TaxID=121494 RepID=UPI0033131B73
MDISRASRDEKLQICRKYYRWGFFCLPFIWLVNFVWFFKDAFRKSNPDKEIRKYLLRSISGVGIWIVVWTTWIVIYQKKRASWGGFGDGLSVTVPGGVP